MFDQRNGWLILSDCYHYFGIWHDDREELHPIENNNTDHSYVMNSFSKPVNCDICKKLLKGIFFQVMIGLIDWLTDVLTDYLMVFFLFLDRVISAFDAIYQLIKTVWEFWKDAECHYLHHVLIQCMLFTPQLNRSAPKRRPPSTLNRSRDTHGD